MTLYRHAQPVPVVSADLLHTAASAIEDLLTTKDRTGACVWFDLPFRLRSAANAHSATVVPDDVLAALQKVARIRLDLNDFDGDRRGIADCLGDAEEALIEVVNRRAAMLHAGNSPAQSDCCPAQNVVVPAQSPIDHGYLPECECSGCKATSRICAELAGNSPVIPDGYVMVPKEATLEMIKSGASAASNGMLIPGIYKAMLAAAECSIPMISDTWIPVSERMPEIGDIVLTAMGGVVNVGEMECSAANCRFFTSVISGRELPATHWMPLPAGPQGVKGE